MAALLRHVRGGEVDDDPLGRKRQADCGEGAPHPLAALGHRLVRQTDNSEIRSSAGDLHLHIDRARLDPFEGESRDPADHGHPPSTP
jgi:hypothetical protein